MSDIPSNVVTLAPRGTDEPPERQIYQCLCGCISFRIFDSGEVQCAKCGQWMREVRAQACE